MDVILKKVLWEVPSIKLVKVESGEYCLIVKGTMLNDYVEEFLWDEYQFEQTSVEIETGSNAATYFNYFDAFTPIEKILELLHKLNLNDGNLSG
jgi:hypothetical protein